MTSCHVLTLLARYNGRSYRMQGYAPAGIGVPWHPMLCRQRRAGLRLESLPVR